VYCPGGKNLKQKKGQWQNLKGQESKERIKKKADFSFIQNMSLLYGLAHGKK
jgi:hypothetical protein